MYVEKSHDRVLFVMQTASFSAKELLFVGGGGALMYQMTTSHRAGECQNIGAVNSFRGKTRVMQVQTKKTNKGILVRCVCFHFFFVNYMIFIARNAS